MLRHPSYAAAGSRFRRGPRSRLGPREYRYGELSGFSDFRSGIIGHRPCMITDSRISSYP